MNPSVTSPRAESAPVDETESSETGGESRGRPGRRSVEDRQRAVLELMAGKATVDQLARRAEFLARPNIAAHLRDGSLRVEQAHIDTASGRLTPEP
jgi:hypothetical protein